MRILVTGSVMGVLIVGAVALVPPTQAEDKEHSPPKLVWEMTFDKNIAAAGVDEERFGQTKEDFSSSLTWIRFTGGGLRYFDRGGKLNAEPVEGYVHQRWVSANGKYFVAAHGEAGSQHGEKIVHFTLFNWEGKRIWETDEFAAGPLVWDDGSAVFLRDQIHGERAWGASFFDTQGQLTNRYLFTEVHNRLARSVGISKDFFVIGTVSSEKGLEVCVFEKSGNLLWKQDRIKRRLPSLQVATDLYTIGGVTVSDRGEVLFLFDNFEDYGTQVFIYDEKGELRDTLLLYPTGALYPLRTDGRLAFVSTGLHPHEPSHLLCYDFAEMKVRFILEAERDQPFGDFDVNVGCGLIAVAVHPFDGTSVLKIYDLDGNYKAAATVDARSQYFWFKLLDGAVLVAEKNNLRLYALEGGE